ncbi:MAG TPA: alpha/beta fold hydrolase, partial [Chroococcales cyanobacterium]
ALISLLALLFLAGLTPVRATSVRSDNLDLGANKSLPAYVWTDPSVKPRAVALCIHGLTLHGGVYEKLAGELAPKGFVVMAPDLQGYGRWQNKPVEYDRSFDSLVALAAAARAKYDNLPLYVIGESLGADLAMRLASQKPDLVDGLVLSSPAIKRRYFLGPILNETTAFLSNPKRQVNLRPYIRRFFSEDPLVTQDTLDDPLVRKRLTAWDLLRTCNAIRPALKYADNLSPEIAVLVIQGSQDRMLRTSAVSSLLQHIKSTNQTVRWFNDRGHLLLETAHLRNDTAAVVRDWFDDQLAAGKQRVAVKDGDHSTITTIHTAMYNQPAAISALTHPANLSAQLNSEFSN